MFQTEMKAVIAYWFTTRDHDNDVQKSWRAARGRGRW